MAGSAWYICALVPGLFLTRVCGQHLRIALALGNIGFLIIWRGEAAPKLAWVATAMARALNMYHMGLALTVPLRSVFDLGIWTCAHGAGLCTGDGHHVS